MNVCLISICILFIFTTIFFSYGLYACIQIDKNNIKQCKNDRIKGVCVINNYEIIRVDNYYKSYCHCSGQFENFSVTYTGIISWSKNFQYLTLLQDRYCPVSNVAFECFHYNDRAYLRSDHCKEYTFTIMIACIGGGAYLYILCGFIYGFRRTMYKQLMNEECSICLEKIDYIADFTVCCTACGNSIHWNCYNQMQDYKCPSCREYGTLES